MYQALFYKELTLTTNSRLASNRHRQIKSLLFQEMIQETVILTMLMVPFKALLAVIRDF